MAQLTDAQRASAEIASDRAQNFIERLDAGNRPRTSALRNEFKRVLGAISKELDVAITRGDASQIDLLGTEVERLDALSESFQEAALVEWSAQYATFVEEIASIVDGKPTQSADIFLRSMSILLEQRWRRYSKAAEPVPSEVRGLYAFYMMRAADTFLDYESRRVAHVKSLEVLDTNDIPNLAFRLGGVSDRLARAAIESFLQQRARAAAVKRAEDEEPGVFSTIWSVVGWDSYSDFAIDVGLMVVTGGGGAFLRWGKSLAKGLKNLDRIRDSKRLGKLARAAKNDLKRVEHARKDVQRRVSASRRANERKSLQRNAREIESQALDAVQWAYDSAKVAIQADKARQDLQETLKAAWALVSDVGTSLAAEAALRAAEEQGLLKHDNKGFVEIAAGDVAEAASMVGVNEIRGLGGRIDRAKQSFVRSYRPPKVGRPLSLYVAWYHLLVRRQVMMRSLAVTARRRTLSPAKLEFDLVEIVIESMTEAFDETLEELWVPKSLIAQVRKQFGTLVRKSAAGWVNETVVTFFKQ